MARHYPVSFRLDDVTLALLVAIADGEYVTRTMVIRAALREYARAHGYDATAIIRAARARSTDETEDNDAA